MAIYRDIYDGPPRWYTATRTRKKYIMIHATANDASAEAEASYAKRRPDRVSSHYYVDDDSIVQSLDTDYRAWHAGNREGNDHAIAYELTARNMNVGRAWWLDNIAWPLMVAAIARDCREFGIRPRELTDAQLRAGNTTGFTTHVQGNRVWGGSDHTDPGPNFPMDHLVRQVQRALEDDVELNDRFDVLDWVTERHGVSSLKVSTALGSTYGHVRSARHQLREVAARQEAILAASKGDDVVAAVRAELDRHRGALIDELVDELGPDLTAELRAKLEALRVRFELVEGDDV